MSKKEVVLLKDAPAEKVTVTGWVGADRRFYGDDEHLAKWSLCTHIECNKCGAPTPKGYTICKDCRSEQNKLWYKNLKSESWDGETPLYADAIDKWFFYSYEEIYEELQERDLTLENLRLVIAKPVMFQEIDPSYFLESIDAPEEVDTLPDEMQRAIDGLNETIRKLDKPSHWEPGKTKPELEPINEVLKRWD